MWEGENALGGNYRIICTFENKKIIMDYFVLGKSITIDSMQKPNGDLGSVFEFTSKNSLNEIGLNQKFWFRCNYGFSNEIPVSQDQAEITSSNNGYQEVLSTILEKCISDEKLTNQFEQSLFHTK